MLYASSADVHIVVWALWHGAYPGHYFRVGYFPVRQHWLGTSFNKLWWWALKGQNNTLCADIYKSFQISSVQLLNEVPKTVQYYRKISHNKAVSKVSTMSECSNHNVTLGGLALHNAYNMIWWHNMTWYSVHDISTNSQTWWLTNLFLEKTL